MKLKLFAAIFIVQICSAFICQAQTIHLAIAASMTEVFKEIIAVFSEEHPHNLLRPNFASSGSLAKQIEQGAPADFYVSANPKWMQYLIEKQMITADTERIFAHNSLVFIGEKAGTAHSLADLVHLDRIALGSPQNVPAGQYARQALEKAGIYTVLERQRKLILAKDVRQALLYAEQGEVDGAFVYKTDALLASRAQVLFTVPDNLHEKISYPMALTKTGANNELAIAFFNFMNSSTAQNIVIKYGFTTAP